MLTRAETVLRALWSANPSAGMLGALAAPVIDDLARLLAADPTDEPARVALGHLYWSRHENHGAQADLDDAVRVLSPLFHPEQLYLVPEGLRTEIADAYGTHVGTQLAQALAAGDNAGTELTALAWWCSFLLAHADPDNDHYGNHLCALGSVLFHRYHVLDNVDDLLKAVSLLSLAVRVTPVGHTNGPSARAGHALALAGRYTLTKSFNDLRTAREACTGALRLSLRDEQRDGLMRTLASLLGDLMPRALAERRWDEGLEAGRAAMEHPELARYAQESVATILERRFLDGASGLADLDEAIRLRTSLAREPGNGLAGLELARTLNRLGYAYWLRHQHAKRSEDLDAVVDTLEQALGHVPDDDMTIRWDILRKLAVALMERVERGRPAGESSRADDADDVERAIAVIRAGLDRSDGGQAPAALRAVLGRELPWALWHRYMRERRAEDLDELTESLSSAAVQEITSPESAVLQYGSLATEVHRARYRAGQGLGALHASVAAGRDALAKASPGHPGAAAVLAQIGVSLVHLFHHTGELSALDEAVESGRESVRAVGEEALDGPRGVNPLHLLGIALSERGAHTGSLDDLNAAVRTLRRSYDSPEPEKGRNLYGLGLALVRRAERVAEPAGLDEGITLMRRAAELDDDEMSTILSGLSHALLLRYRASSDPADLEEALVIARRAADALPKDDPGSLHALTSLTAALSDEQRRRPDRVDVDELVALCQQVVDLAPPDHSGLALFRHNLGLARKAQADAVGLDPMLQAFAEVTGKSLTPFTVVEAVHDLSEAARSETTVPSQRIRSALAAAHMIAPSDVLHAHFLLEYAVGIIPLLAPRRINRADQQRALKDVSELVTRSVAVTLIAGETPHPPGWPRAMPHPAIPAPLLPDAELSALQTLERGRAVLHSRMLDTRGDISELRRHHPELAERFVRLRDLLDSETVATGDDPAAAEQATAALGSLDRPRAASELAATLDEIRDLPGFASFARPPEPETLVAAAAEGPVAVFNCDPSRCDALLVTRHGIRHLPLPGLTHAEVSRQADLFHRTLAVVTDPLTGFRAQREAQRTLSGILGWLWDVAAEPVLRALGFDSGTGRDSDPPRVWWSPGGLLGALPLHAAGHHGESAEQGGDRTVLDRVVSSYTPTIRALHYARRPRADGGGPERSLVVAMPFTPGAAPLPGALAEAEVVAAALPSPTVLAGPTGAEPPAGAPVPTKRAVLDGLTDAHVIHFACHAVTDPVDPSHSRLMLWDHLSSPLTVAGVASVTLDEAQLAYLSACRTSDAAAADLQDEAIHLTSAFQLAGFRHVVGTLWEADDIVSARIAQAFYASLTGAGGLDCSRSAAALRTAVLAERDLYPHTPSLWAGHVHAGA
ncbi:CHAT domain-containing protein [Streptomyces sp. WG7]|uniref:CHAT domain-containing protein n=1 Tax=Streptomyces sp. WG7 TaxID=3417650 RepID=UPI003CFA4AEE